MCELSVFTIFLKNVLSKVNKILGLTIFKARKDFEGSNQPFPITVAEYFAPWNVYNSLLFA